MSLSITNIGAATAAEWDEIWRECDYATYFHSREWAEIWSAYKRNRFAPQPIIVEFSDKKRALLPLSVMSSFRGFVRTSVSSPGDTYGGWIAKDRLIRDHVELLTSYLFRIGDLRWRLNPYDEELAAFRHRAAVSLDCESDDTHYLELTPGFDAVHGKFKKNSAWGIRKAQAAGVRVRTANSKEDWIAYYAIYQDSLQRWGDRASSRYQFEIFEEMFDRQSPHIQLWLAIYSDEIVAGAVCFYSKRHVVYWHGAALSSHFNVQPVNLLMHDIIQHACQLGYRWFDFNPSGGHQGVRAFKNSFGASPRDASVVIRRSTARKMSEWAASSLARRP